MAELTQSMPAEDLLYEVLTQMSASGTFSVLLWSGLNQLPLQRGDRPIDGKPQSYGMNCRVEGGVGGAE